LVRCKVIVSNATLTQKFAVRAGLGVAKSRIVEVGAVALDSGEEFTTLVNPNGVDIQMAAYRAHGISMQDVEHASVPMFRCCCIAIPKVCLVYDCICRPSVGAKHHLA